MKGGLNSLWESRDCILDSIFSNCFEKLNTTETLKKLQVEQMEINRQWTFFTLLTATVIYWTVNLILWFPWSINAILGITLMLTVAPFIWAFGVFQCLKKYDGKKLIHGAILTAMLYILMAVISDYIFFGIFRDAMDELYHPTTFYGYLFLISLPFMLMSLFSNKLKNKEGIEQKDFVLYTLIGTFSMATLFLIIHFHITI